MMQTNARPRFPENSLLAAMLNESAPHEARRALRRLRAEGAPAVAVEGDVTVLAGGLASSTVSQSPAVLDGLPPLFWLEAPRGHVPDQGGRSGWIVEGKPNGLVARRFGIAADSQALPEPEGIWTVRFGSDMEEDQETPVLRGLITAVSLPDMLSRMGEASPIVLMPAEAPDAHAGFLRGWRLLVALSSDSIPR
ncbi:hypothetical protein ACFOD4_01875 [Pseudoroseomonas globiformis]|uniref:Uncharacterized protein n=1 Tax=Teichococcus globiformis TaxID=2307229 RepID=A0ABV7FUC8_9PROT